MGAPPTTRRGFLAAGLVLLGLPPLLFGQQEGMPGQGSTGTLRDPAAAGLPRAPSSARDNDPFIYEVEHRIKCQCGCNLDVYTCRTTDFTCQTSPRMHREVLALQDQGKSAQEIVDAFVAEYGEQALMAPKPQGFNLAGYWVPGILITLAGTILTAYLVRRGRVSAGAEAVGVVGAGVGTAEGTLEGVGSKATPEELERLRRAIAEADD